MAISTKFSFVSKLAFSLILLLVAMGMNTKAQTIATSPLTNNYLCPCNTYNVDFTSTGAFTVGNSYSAELSNAAGSFASPTLVGFISSNANSGTILATIPCNTPSGTQYRIRVTSNNPSVIGADNGTNISITQNPSAPVSAISVPAGLCDPGGTAQLSAVSTNNSINWYTAPTGGTYLGNSASGVNFPTSLTSTTSYYAEALIGGVAVSGSSTFGFTGGMQTFVVPPGITNIQIECYGAQGGSSLGASPSAGGNGGYAAGTLAVTPGQVLNIFVGGQGSVATGGYNGGGLGGDLNAGGGGGASDVRVGGITLADRVIVAGGGGGAGSEGCGVGVFPGGNGGAGGGGIGFAGVNSPTGGGGAGGSVGAGGAAGAGCINFAGSPGTVPNGGNGQAIGCATTPGGGGGGGGFVNGGGGGGGTLGNALCSGNDKGGGGGGAGGSNNTGTLTNTSVAQGFNIGNGTVVINWTGSPTTCVSASRTALTVPVNPNPTVTASPTSATVCPGSMHTLSGGGAASYSWTGPQTITDNTPFSATTAGTYTVTGTSAVGCTNTATSTVGIYNVAINANASPASSVCLGQQVTLTGSGGVSYSWTAPVVDGDPFTPNIGTITYTVTGTDANGCTSTSTIDITANNAPNAPNGLSASPTSLCMPGGIVQLSAISTNNNINWYTTPTGGAVLGNTPSGSPYAANISSTTTYFAEATLVGVGTCVSATRTPITVIVHPLPPVVSTPSTVNGCNNINVTLVGSGALNYTWSGPQVVSNNVPFVATTSGIYTVTGTDVNNCSNTATVTVNVNPLPTVGLTINPGATICQGDIVTLAGTGANNYTWTGGINNNVPFVPGATSSYTVTGTDAFGCTNTNTVIVTVNQSTVPIVALASNPTVVYPGANVTYTASVPASVGAYQLHWFVNNAYYTTVSSPTNFINYTPTLLGDSIYVYMTPLQGCYNPDSAKSNSIKVRFPQDIEDLDIPNGFVIYPNPSNGIFNVNGLLADDKMIFTDVVGKVILKKTFTSNQTEAISIENLTTGVYYARFERDGKVWVVKVVKE